jgi:hypothetical protein
MISDTRASFAKDCGLVKLPPETVMFYLLQNLSHKEILKLRETITILELTPSLLHVEP